MIIVALTVTALWGCHDAKENRPQSDEGSQPIQPTTKNPPVVSYARLDKVKPESDRAKTIFGEALAKMAYLTDEAVKEKNHSVMIEWQYISPKATSSHITYTIALKTLDYSDQGVNIHIKDVTPGVIKQVSTSPGLTATPQSFISHGCTIGNP